MRRAPRYYWPFISLAGSGRGRTCTMYRKGLAPDSYRFFIDRRSSWLRSLSMISSNQLMRSSLAFSTQLTCHTPFRSDSIGGSKPVPGCLFNSFYLLFIDLFSFFQKCQDPNPQPDPNGRSKPEPGLLRHFHLSYQNIYLCHFVLGFSIKRKHFQMVGP